MKLETTMRLPVKIDEVFNFFAEASNLEKITPPELRFRIITPTPIDIKKDTLIEYKLGLFGISFGWLTRISAWDPPHYFVDEQLKGPYKKWVHTHRFTADGNETIIEDSVDYELPLFLLSLVALPVVKLQLKRIFSHRQKMVRKLILKSTDVV